MLPELFEHKHMQFIYLFLSIYFGRKNPIFFLVFPLALLQGPGAFIDTRTVLVAPNLFLGSNILKDITIFYMIGVIIYLRNRINLNLVLKTPMKWLTIYILFLVLSTLVSYGTSYEGIAVIRLFLYMVFGYYLLILLFSAVSYQQFVQFFNILFWVNAVQSVLYVLNSSKTLAIFDESMIFREIEAGTGLDSFIRDFSTIPMFSGLLFMYGIVSLILNENVFNKKAIYATLITYPFVLLYTFTRSNLLGAGLQVIIVLIIIIKLKPTKILRPYIIVLFIGGMVLLGIVKNNFGSEFGYFSDRMEGVTSEGVEEGNVNLRIQYHEKAWELLSMNSSLWIGNGLNKELETSMGELGAWAGDSTIPFLLIYTGIIGVLIFYWNQLYFIILCIRNSFYGMNSLAIALFSGLFVSFFTSLIMGGNAWGSPVFYMDFVYIMFIKQLYDHAKHKNTKTYVPIPTVIAQDKLK